MTDTLERQYEIGAVFVIDPWSNRKININPDEEFYQDDGGRMWLLVD